MSLLDELRVDIGDDAGTIPSGIIPVASSGIPIGVNTTPISELRVDIGDDGGTIPTGTLVNGVPVHNLLGPEHGDTTTDSPSVAALIVGGNPTWKVLPSGQEGYQLSIFNGDIAWRPDAGAAGGITAAQASGIASGIAVETATTGIAIHSSDPNAHHSRYTDAEAQAAATGAVTLQTAFDASATVQALGEPSVDFKRIQMSGAGFLLQDISPDTPVRLRIEDEVGNRIVDFKVGEIDFQGFGGISASGDVPVLRISDETDAINIWPEDVTFTSAPGSIFRYSSITTHDYPNVRFGALNLQGTVVHEQAGFPFNHFLLFNNGNTFKNANGVAANFGPGQTFISQPTLQADGASISMSQNRDFLSQPNFNTINGGALAVTTWSQVQLIGQINTGVTLSERNAIRIQPLTGAGGTLTTERGIWLENLNRGSTIIGIDSDLTGTSKTFINHPGTSPSIFGGEIQMSDGVSLRLGTDGGNSVEIFRPSPGVMRMIGVDGTFNEGLDWDFENSNNVAITSSTSAGLNFDLSEIAFGPSTVADGTNNWVFAFSPGLRATQLAGDYSEVLFTSSSSISIAHAITNFATWTINAPTISIGAGSITNAANVLIQTNMSQGTNRYGLLITSNPTGGTLNYALRVTAGDSRFDGRVDINNGVALGGGLTALLGTIGGSGPTSVTQAQWLEVDIGGTPHWIPVWT